MRRNQQIVAMIVMALSAAFVCADTVDIDFEDVSGMTFLRGYRTKSPSITQTVAHPGSDGSQSLRFIWYTDGSYSGQYAYALQALSADMDFSDATMSWWDYRENRSTDVGVSLWDDGVLVAEWQFPSSPGAWAQRSLTVGVDAASKTGSGDIASVDQIGFWHMNEGGPGSGLSHIVRYDDFVATNVVPEPFTMGLLLSGFGVLAIRSRNKSLRQ